MIRRIVRPNIKRLLETIGDLLVLCADERDDEFLGRTEYAQLADRDQMSQ